MIKLPNIITNANNSGTSNNERNGKSGDTSMRESARGTSARGSRRGIQEVV